MLGFGALCTGPIAGGQSLEPEAIQGPGIVVGGIFSRGEWRGFKKELDKKRRIEARITAERAAIRAETQRLRELSSLVVNLATFEVDRRPVENATHALSSVHKLANEMAQARLRLEQAKANLANAEEDEDEAVSFLLIH